MDHDIKEVYGNKVRLRVCGLCWNDGRLLLVNHRGLSGGEFWAPPGGGVEFGQTLEQNLTREFKEETGVDVEISPFMFACEYINAPLHAIELFFGARITDGQLPVAGTDPELQIIQGLRYFTPDQIKAMDASGKHGIFRIATRPEEFIKLGGIYRI